MRKKTRLIILLFAFSVLMSGCNLAPSIRHESLRQNQSVINGYVNTQSEIAISATEREQAIVDSMTLMLDNGRLQLYFGEYHDIAVKDLLTGKIFLSGDALYDHAGTLDNNNMYRFAASQLHLEYYDRLNLLKTKSTYPDCYLDKTIQQVFVEKTNSTVKVTYHIGQRDDQYIIPYVLTGEEFNRLKKAGDELVESKVLTKTAVGQFVRAYRKIAVSALSDKDREELAKKYEHIAQLGTIYVVMPNLTNKVKGLVSSVCVALDVDADYIQTQVEAVGVTELDTDSPYSMESDYFIIPVEYSLDQGDLLVRVLIDEIVSSRSAYLARVSLLNTFASNRTDEEGYLFIPDGSGSIIDNNTSVYGMTQVDIPFYGQDFGVSYDRYARLAPPSSFPVFGLKDSNSAVFGIVESGDAMGGAIGRVGMATFHYASAFPYFRYYTQDYLNRTANVFAYSSMLPTDAFTVRYHFLYGEDSDYSGMARYFRSYMEQRGILHRRLAQEDPGLNIRLFGAINKMIPILGIPVKQTVATTTVEQAMSMMDFLSKSGIPKIDFIYTEILMGAREHRAPIRMDISREIGGEHGYDQLVAHAKKLGYKVYPGVDFGRVVKNGNGLTRADDFILRISRDEAVLYDNPVVPAGTQVMKFVNPLRYEQLGKSFLASYLNREGKGIYLQTLGAFLSSNFNEKEGLTRNGSQLLTIRLLEQMSDSHLDIKLDAGAMYTLPYAGSLVNVHLNSSETRLEKHAVPFTGMVLKGYLPFSGSPVNNSDDDDRSFLKALENGAELYYEVMGEEPFILADTEYTDMYSVNASIWLDDMVSRYGAVREALKGHGNIRLHSHRQLADEVFETTYENGTKVLVNYTDSDFHLGQIQVEALGYVILPEDMKEGGL